MSWHKGGGRGRRGYHHGNLREALIGAALDLISQKGPAGVTFAEAARMAGVSTAAPYRHYRDRDALLADVAKQGFEKFGEVLEAAWNGGKPDAASAFERTGRAYLAFARDEPAYFAAMFESGIPLDSNPELHEAADKAFGVLRGASDHVSAAAPEGSRPPSLMVALHIWALTHGIASLFGRADGARRKIPMSPEELLEAGVLVYLQGLGLGPKGGETGKT
jgi:AcrR family transcriptional regulator